MLVRFRVKNFALIRDLDLSPQEGLNIITGETGAGKSILIGALGLILGERADSKAILAGEDKCVVEGHFSIKPYKLKDFFEANDLDYDDHTVIRRELLSSGKSRAFINDTPVQLTILRELSLKLVDIHSQHETLLLNNRNFQLSLIDTFAGIDLGTYHQLYREVKKLESRLTGLREQDANARRDQDYFRFQFDELSAADLQAGEQELLEQEAEMLSNAGEIQQACGEVVNAMSEGEDNVLDRLNTVRSLLQQAAKHHQVLKPLLERMDSSLIELKDIVAEVEHSLGGVSLDPGRLEEVNNRLALVYNLQKKHRVSSVSELINIADELGGKLEGLDNLDREIGETENKLKQQTSYLLALAAEISAQRKAASGPVEKEVNKLLQYVGMPHAAVSIRHDVLPAGEYNATGADDIQVLFATNPGSPYLPVSRIASGGELSRLMLCIKTVMASKTAMPTIVFDEIDTGISGETAQKVGTVMEQLASGHQVITITHLPQIAAKGRSHFFVYKSGDNKVVNTRIRQLSGEERAVEIAKMLSGENPSEIAIATARELLG